MADRTNPEGGNDLWDTYRMVRDRHQAAYDARHPRCESCAASGIDREAVTHSTNPDYAGYELCDECAAEYNSRRN